MNKKLYYSELFKALKTIAKNPENQVHTKIWTNPKSNFLNPDDSVGVVTDKNDKPIFEAPKNHEGKIFKRDKNGTILEDQSVIIPKDISANLYRIIIARMQWVSKLDRNLDLAQTNTLKYLKQFANYSK